MKKNIFLLFLIVFFVFSFSLEEKMKPDYSKIKINVKYHKLAKGLLYMAYLDSKINNLMVKK